MSGISRRDALRFLAASATLPLAWSCKGAPSTTSATRVTQDDLLLGALVRVANELSQSNWSVIARVTQVVESSAVVDAEGRSTAQAMSSALSLRLRGLGQEFVEESDSVTPASIEAAGKRLASRAFTGGVKRARSRARKRVSFLRPIAPYSPVARALELHRQQLRIGGSPTIYRAAESTRRATKTWLVTDELIATEESTRRSEACVFGAYTGSEPVFERSHAVSFLENPSKLLGEKELRTTSKRALAPLISRTAPEGSFRVLVSPDIAAWILGTAAAKQFASGVGLSAPVQIRDTPREMGLANFDASGVRLVDRDMSSGNTPSQRLPTALRIVPGTKHRDELTRELENGLILDGAISVSSSGRGDHFAIRASRAWRVENGQPTGRSYGRIVASAETKSFFADIAGVARDSVTVLCDLDENRVATAPALLSTLQLVPA